MLRDVSTRSAILKQCEENETIKQRKASRLMRHALVRSRLFLLFIDGMLLPHLKSLQMGLGAFQGQLCTRKRAQPPPKRQLILMRIAGKRRFAFLQKCSPQSREERTSVVFQQYHTRKVNWTYRKKRPRKNVFRINDVRNTPSQIYPPNLRIRKKWNQLRHVNHKLSGLGNLRGSTRVTIAHCCHKPYLLISFFI